MRTAAARRSSTASESRVCACSASAVFLCWQCAGCSSSARVGACELQVNGARCCCSCSPCSLSADSIVLNLRLFCTAIYSLLVYVASPTPGRRWWCAPWWRSSSGAARLRATQSRGHSRCVVCNVDFDAAFAGQNVALGWAEPVAACICTVTSAALERCNLARRLEQGGAAAKTPF